MVFKKLVIFLVIIVSYLIAGTFLFLTYRDHFILSFSEKSCSLAIFSGLLGSAVYMTRGFYQSAVEKVDNSKMFDFERWIWWYLSRPILGAIAGGLAFLIIFLAFDFTETTKNQTAFVLLGFLSGYNFHEFIEKRISKRTDLS
ncbi:MAG: hypothetical protein U9R38_05150 [Candidatus Margulisiibacteriota bacterium]|nr:hypothetical protein [Candidatus Margulisiibacteriota bacterium]